MRNNRDVFRLRGVLPVLAVVLAAMALPRVAAAGTSCFTVEDPDQRAYCRAVNTRSVGNCSAISDYSLRQTCRARLSASKTPCNTVSTSWEREQCRREAEKR